MSLRDIIVLGIVFISLPFCLLRPWIGILVFSWLGYMNPHKYAWGIAPSFPVALIVAVPTLVGFIITKDKAKFPFERESIVIILLWIFFTITSFFAFYPQLAWDMWEKTSKIFVMSIITIPLFMDRKKLKYLMLTIGLSLGFLGAKGGIFSIVHAGQWNVRGPEDTFIAGEGDFGLALNMVLPILFYLGKEEENKQLKMLLYGTFALTVLSVIFTYRRGAFLSLAVVILLLAIKSQKKIFGAVVLSATLIIAPYFITERWANRMETIKEYEQDTSAMGRINAWKTAFNVAKDRPFTGAGFDGLSYGTVARYSPHPSATAGDVHSIYFEVLGEHGFIAFGLFVLLLLFCFFSLRKIKKRLEGVHSAGWMRNYSDMLQISLIAYMAGGVFLGRAYFDLFYHLVAVIVVLKVLAAREINSTVAETASANLKTY